jgi:hypothetical protein
MDKKHPIPVIEHSGTSGIVIYFKIILMGINVLVQSRTGIHIEIRVCGPYASVSAARDM